jgi:flagellar biosynthetic protein FliR
MTVSVAAIYSGLVLARIGAFVAVMPIFAQQTPRMIRVSLAMALAAFYVTVVSPGWDPTMALRGADLPPIRYAIVLLREALIGAAMGFVFNLFLLPARVAGEFVTYQVGLNLTPQISPTGSDSAGPVTNLFEIIAALVFLVADGHHIVLLTLHGSFVTLPLGGSNLPQAGPMVTGLGTAYEMGLLLAGPLALCLFLLSVTLAILSRAAPQLNIYSIGFTLQISVVLLGGLFLLPEFVATIYAVIAHTGEALPKYLGG